MYVVILETFSYVQYFYTQKNNNQMQSELFNNMFEEFIKCFWPFKRAAMMLIWPTVNTPTHTHTHIGNVMGYFSYARTIYILH